MFGKYTPPYWHDYSSHPSPIRDANRVPVDWLDVTRIMNKEVAATAGKYVLPYRIDDDVEAFPSPIRDDCRAVVLWQDVMQILNESFSPNLGVKTMSDYQELLDGSAADCCADTFGASAGEDALVQALAEARADSDGAGWNTFLKKFLTAFEGRLSVVPKIEIEATALLTLIGTWFDKIVGPMDFVWIPDSVEDVIKGLMKNALLMGAEFVINKILGK